MARGFKTGGRKPGTCNKTSSFCKELINDILTGYFEGGQLGRDLEQLLPKERLDVMIKLISYVMPKPQAVAVDVKTTSDNSLIEKLNQLAELYEN